MTFVLKYCFLFLFTFLFSVSSTTFRDHAELIKKLKLPHTNKTVSEQEVKSAFERNCRIQSDINKIFKIDKPSEDDGNITLSYSPSVSLGKNNSLRREDILKLSKMLVVAHEKDAYDELPLFREHKKFLKDAIQQKQTNIPEGSELSLPHYFDIILHLFVKDKKIHFKNPIVKEINFSSNGSDYFNWFSFRNALEEQYLSWLKSDHKADLEKDYLNGLNSLQIMVRVWVEYKKYLCESVFFENKLTQLYERIYGVSAPKKRGLLPILDVSQHVRLLEILTDFQKSYVDSKKLEAFSSNYGGDQEVSLLKDFYAQLIRYDYKRLLYSELLEGLTERVDRLVASIIDEKRLNESFSVVTHPDQQFDLRLNKALLTLSQLGVLGIDKIFFTPLNKKKRSLILDKLNSWSMSLEKEIQDFFPGCSKIEYTDEIVKQNLQGNVHISFKDELNKKQSPRGILKKIFSHISTIQKGNIRSIIVQNENFLKTLSVYLKIFNELGINQLQDSDIINCLEKTYTTIADLKKCEKTNVLFDYQKDIPLKPIDFYINKYLLKHLESGWKPDIRIQFPGDMDRESLIKNIVQIFKEVQAKKAFYQTYLEDFYFHIYHKSCQTYEDLFMFKGEGYDQKLLGLILDTSRNFDQSKWSDYADDDLRKILDSLVGDVKLWTAKCIKTVQLRDDFANHMMLYTKGSIEAERIKALFQTVGIAEQVTVSEKKPSKKMSSKVVTDKARKKAMQSQNKFFKELDRDEKKNKNKKANRKKPQKLTPEKNKKQVSDQKNTEKENVKAEGPNKTKKKKKMIKCSLKQLFKTEAYGDDQGEWRSVSDKRGGNKRGGHLDNDSSLSKEKAAKKSSQKPEKGVAKKIQVIVDDTQERQISGQEKKSQPKKKKRRRKQKNSPNRGQDTQKSPIFEEEKVQKVEELEEKKEGKPKLTVETSRHTNAKEPCIENLPISKEDTWDTDPVDTDNKPSSNPEAENEAPTEKVSVQETQPNADPAIKQTQQFSLPTITTIQGINREPNTICFQVGDRIFYIGYCKMQNQYSFWGKDGRATLKQTYGNWPNPEKKLDERGFQLFSNLRRKFQEWEALSIYAGLLIDSPYKVFLLNHASKGMATISAMLVEYYE